MLWLRKATAEGHLELSLGIGEVRPPKGNRPSKALCLKLLKHSTETLLSLEIVNDVSFFNHIDPCQTQCVLTAHIKDFSQSGIGLGDAISEAADVAHAAVALFQGIYPKESPCFFWGEGVALPWHADYAQERGEGDRHRARLSAEINAIAAELHRQAGTDWSAGPIWQVTYQSAVLCESVHLTVQGLVVETLLCVDGLLERLVTSRWIQALAWQAGVFKNLIGALEEAQHLAPPHSGVTGGE